jgi:hypothetical protein
MTEGSQPSAPAADAVKAPFDAALGVISIVVHETAGRAMAAVLLGKPPEAVTLEEASAALVDFAVPGNADLTWRAVRAGLRASALKLSPAFPDALAGELVGAIDALDAGEARGMATPAKIVRGGGKPARYGPPSRRRDLGRWLVTEMAFQTGQRGLTFDEAVGLVTGVTRNRQPSPHGQPLLPLGSEWDAVRGFVDRARKADREMWAAAKAQGEAAARGETLDDHFLASRLKVLAWAKHPEAWGKILREAKMLAPRAAPGP